MKVSKVHIKNFRILHNICLTLDNITTIVGANGSGKSTLLHALHAFFDPKFKLSTRDLWHEDTSQTIEITLEFVGLTAKEKQEFTKYVHKDTLKVTKTFKIENGELQQKYFGYILYFPAFEEIRRSQDVRDMVAKYDEFRKNHPDFNLKEAKKKNEIIAELERWENEHPDRCEETQSEHQFFGFKEVGGGKIDKYLKFLFVPAVKDPAKEADEEGKGWFSELVDTLIRSQITNNPELRKLNDKVKKEYKEKLNTLEVHKLQNSINQTLPHYAPNTSVKLKWNTDEFDPLTTLSLKVGLVEDGYETDLIQAGHGAQRAFLMTLSQSLGDVLTEGDKTLILGIEEPELYQHPTRLRHIARNLYASSTMANQNSRLQLILVTHSPYFITVEALDTLRRFRKSSEEIHVAEISLKDIVNQLCDAYKDYNYITIKALKANPTAPIS